LVVAAQSKGSLPTELKDSKLMSKTQRLKILNKLSICCSFGEGWVSVAEIDKLGLAGALRLGVRRALKALKVPASSKIIIDGLINYCPKQYKNAACLVRADSLVPIVSAASVHAKVKRDSYMAELAKRHPDYGFEKHVGYGTKEHLKALDTYGVLKSVHRLSYAPIAARAEAG